MKLLATSLLAGAATAAVSANQQPLQLPKSLPDQARNVFSNQLHNLNDALHGLTDEASAVWDEVAMLFPEEMSKASFFSAPKKHNRRPDSEWDHIVRGEDVQSVWVRNEQGEQERRLDGKLESYDVRV